MEISKIMLSLFACISIALHYSEAVRIGFGELDYVGREGEMMATVLVTKSEPTTEDLTVPIMAMSYAQFYGMGRTLSDDFDTIDIPDPAEYSSDPAGRRDFEQSGPIFVTFAPSDGIQDREVSIPLVDDDINEGYEGFFVVVLHENISIPELSITLVRGGVTLVKIEDNDLIPIGFEAQQYSFQEADMFVDSVFVTKGDVISEQNLTLLVQFSANEVAVEGEDFILERLIKLTFTPEDVRLPVPFQLLADSIPEDNERENFRLYLSINESKPGLRIGTNFSTVVNIIDDDIVFVGFEKETYTVMEGDGSGTVCVEVKEPEAISLLVAATARTADGSAVEGEDYFRPFLNFVALPTTTNELKHCFIIPILDDNITESDEEFVVRLEQIDGFTPSNVNFTISEVIIRIVDDDREPDQNPIDTTTGATPSEATPSKATPSKATPTKAKPKPTTKRPKPIRPTRRPKPSKAPPTKATSPKPNAQKPRKTHKPALHGMKRINRLYNMLKRFPNRGPTRNTQRPAPGNRNPAPGNPSPVPDMPEANPCFGDSVETSGTSRMRTGTSTKRSTRRKSTRRNRRRSRRSHTRSRSGSQDEGMMCGFDEATMRTTRRGSTRSSSGSTQSSSRSSTSNTRSTNTRSTRMRG